MDGPDSTRSCFKNVMIAESTDINFTLKCNENYTMTIGKYLHFLNIFLINANTRLNYYYVAALRKLT